MVSTNGNGVQFVNLRKKQVEELIKKEGLNPEFFQWKNVIKTKTKTVTTTVTFTSMADVKNGSKRDFVILASQMRRAVNYCQSMKERGLW